MRIVSWNVNGILTINQYKPWKDLEDLEVSRNAKGNFSLLILPHSHPVLLFFTIPRIQACLEHLQADMVCFQETKITRKSALSQRQICILPS